MHRDRESALTYFLLSFKVLKERIWSIINILSKQLEIESKAPDHQCQFYAYVSQRSPVRSMPPADTMQSSIDGNFSNLMVEISLSSWPFPHEFPLVGDYPSWWLTGLLSSFLRIKLHDP